MKNCHDKKLNHRVHDQKKLKGAGGFVKSYHGSSKIYVARARLKVNNTNTILVASLKLMARQFMSS